MDSATDGFIVFDADLDLVEINRAALALASVGTRRGELLGRNLRDLYPPAQESGRLQRFQDVIRTGDPFFADDVFRWGFSDLHLSVKAFKVGQGLGLILNDITERKRLEAVLRQMATTDPLTGVNNRRKLVESGEREFLRARRHGRELSALMVDVDHFKKLNDRFGHQAGDEVLKTLTDTCLEVLRTEDLFGRFGGEEFVAVLPETGESSAVRVADRLCRSVSRLKRLAGRNDLHMTVSIGVATMQDADRGLEDLLDRADRAMYQAKAAGRNRITASRVRTAAASFQI